MSLHWAHVLRAAAIGGAIVIAQPSGVFAQAADTVVVPDLGNQDMKPWIAKNNAFIGLLNDTLRAKESFNRYASWVDLKKGPTGKERIIYGLYSVSAGSGTKTAEAARRAATTEPLLPPLDTAARDLADAFDALVPVLNEAEAYYERQDYKADKMEGGKALHGRLMPLFTRFLGARERMEARMDEFKAGLDTQELDRVERTEGKSYRWHSKRAIMFAERAVRAMPRDPRKPDLKTFDERIAAFAGVVKEFDAFVLSGAEKKPGMMDSQPRSLLGELRELRDKAAQHMDPTFYQIHYNNVINQYNMMINLSNAFSR